MNYINNNKHGSTLTAFKNFDIGATSLDLAQNMVFRGCQKSESWFPENLKKRKTFSKKES